MQKMGHYMCGLLIRSIDLKIPVTSIWPVTAIFSSIFLGIVQFLLYPLSWLWNTSCWPTNDYSACTIMVLTCFVIKTLVLKLHFEQSCPLYCDLFGCTDLKIPVTGIWLLPGIYSSVLLGTVSGIFKHTALFTFGGGQCWRGGESTGLPLMWPGFDLRTRRQMWIEFVGSLLCSERFFPLTKNQHLICVDLNFCLPN